MTDTRRRVKVYTLNEDRQWDDRGTGHVSSGYVERLKGTSLLVRAESDGSLLLESKINPNTAYQKQQDTLIVWCRERDPSVDITQDVVDESEEERFDDMSSPGLELPPCELNRLEDLAETGGILTPVTTAARETGHWLWRTRATSASSWKCSVCVRIWRKRGTAPPVRNHKRLFLLNRTALFEVMFSEECIMDVIGCLEFDPALSQPRRHREFLTKTARFKEVIPHL
ncbi:hypothetical protein KUCAC02_019798 [Chaenocephalus aceratus]|uniref:Uncharacterized protein n=1 Tax=Chaenocephalus aceratus TaxID=36190 RepID=A0ACB9VR94_CHAAC|nr:hypothetical protein KUCAC02_019798 [Chaenocephalus aceratus]